jgi:hypothetical protein
MYLTFGQAAREAGVAKSTISKALASGKPSYREKNSDGYNCFQAGERRHGRHRQPHRREVFDRHEFAEKPRERYVLMRTKSATKSALSGARRADVTGFGVRIGTKFPNEQFVR